jgi:hypothetical protein
VDTQAIFWQTLKKAGVQTSKRANELLEEALYAPEELWAIGDITKTGDQGGAAYAAIPEGTTYIHRATVISRRITLRAMSGRSAAIWESPSVRPIGTILARCVPRAI